MRQINKIIIHCSATSPDMDIGRKEIDIWHKNRRWKMIGYHFVIRRDGRPEFGRPAEMIGAGVKGMNKNSLHICFVGGVNKNGKPEDNFTDAQMKTGRELISNLKNAYPSATVHGHNEFANKACPCFEICKLEKQLSWWERFWNKIKGK